MHIYTVAMLSGNFQLVAKRAEYGQGNYEKRRQAAESLVPLETSSGVFADIFHPWANERAGRATMLGNAGGGADFALRHPVLYETGSTLAGAGLGALAGGTAGGLLGLGVASMDSGGEASDYLSAGAGIGGAVGGGIGAIAGAIRSIVQRRLSIEKAQKDYARSGRDPEVPQFNSLATLWPSRGSHRKGQMDAYQYLSGQANNPRQFGGLTNAMYATQLLGSSHPVTAPLAVAAALGGGTVQNVDAVMRARKAMKAMNGG